MHKKRRCAVLLLALLLACAAMPARAAVFYLDVRVLISTGKQSTLSFTPVGTFTLQEAPNMKIGDAACEVSVVGGRVLLEAGGQSITAPSLTFKSGNYGEREDYIRLKNAEHGTCTYLGDMTFDIYEGAVRVINTLPIEQYLYGVVPHEMSNSFPIDALKAQAVCARGYAVAKCARNAKSAYDLLDTSKDQVYRGYASKNTRAIAAVDATNGQVLTYDGEIIEAYYSASNGGQTEKTGNVWTNDLPYYTHADDPFDLLNASSLEELSFIPETYTAKTRELMDPFVLRALEWAAAQAAGREVSLVGTVCVLPKAPSYDAPSRCYTQAEVQLMVSYEENGQEKTGQLALTLALEDLHFGSFENTLGSMGARKTRLRMQGVERGVYRKGGQAYAGWYLTQRRYGHGVGLSQRGAQERARAGEPYTDILSFYYTNTQLFTVGTYQSAPAISSSVYKVSEAGVSGVALHTPVDELCKGLDSAGALSVVNAKGAPASKQVCTGYFVRVTYQNGMAFFDLPIVIAGDLDGDGEIDQRDLEALKSHLLRETLLTGPRLRAADVNQDGVVDSYDTYRLIQYIHGDASISQGGRA